MNIFDIKRTINMCDEIDYKAKELGWFNIGSSLINDMSSGINMLGIPQMYIDLLKREAENGSKLSSYSYGGGLFLLKEAIREHEKMIAAKSFDENETKFASQISITSGATAAIFYLFSYFREKYKDYNVKMLGLQYCLFETQCKLFEFDYKYVVSKTKTRFLPTIEEIEEELSVNANNIIVLTMPGNPSGEMYSYEEVVKICEICLKTNSILIIDKCQLDIFSDNFEFVNLGSAVLEASAEGITYFVDSFSKLRSIPGARIGYVFSTDLLFGRCIDKWSEFIYCCPAGVFEQAIVMDIIFRTAYYFKNVRECLRKFKYLIIMYGGYKEYKRDYSKIFSDPAIFERMMNEFKEEMQSNSRLYLRNYLLTKEVLNIKDESNISKLEGGYNFLIFLEDKENIGEYEHMKKLTKTMNSKILSHSFFGELVPQPIGGYWYRISCAMRTEDYLERINKLKQALGI